MSNTKKLTKTIVLNNTGNVGKTFIVREVLAKFDPNAYIMEIETHNSSNSKFILQNEVEKFDADNFQPILENFYKEPNANLIVDVGSSNIINLSESFKQLVLINDIFDVFIIPTTSDKKQIDDTFKTIALLLDLKVEPSKIKIICNKTDFKESKFLDDFSLILDGTELYNYKANPSLRIRASDSIKIVEEQNLTIEQFLQDDKDYLQLMGKEEDTKEVKRLSKMLIARQSLKLIQSDLELVYQEIYK